MTKAASKSSLVRKHARVMMSQKMKSPKSLLVRCVANKNGDQWQAFSLEFGLAVQADSFPEARRKLDSMIQSYLYDALVGEDRQHASALLCRRAPWWVFARYYYSRAFTVLRRRRSTRVKPFWEPLSFTPQSLRTAA